jgi:2-phospho-L-lactate guanylyltransferase
MKLGTWAIVPAKSLTRGKSRLRPVLGDGERIGFARQLVEHVLDVVRASTFAGVLVATDGDDVAELALARGVHVLRDPGNEQLGAVVDRALAYVESLGAGAAVVLMADLPWVQPSDLQSLLAALEAHDVVLVRDHLGQHTNALAVTPPRAIATCFGRVDSFAAHCKAALDAGLRLAIVENDQIAFDVDGPADHVHLTKQLRAVET